MYTWAQAPFASQKVGYINNISSSHTVDMDGDGDDDVLFSSGTDTQIFWYENQENGLFSTGYIVSMLVNDPKAIQAIDMDGDGDKDVLSMEDYHKIVWYENLGNNLYSVQKDIVTTQSPRTLYAADLDGDGDNDIISAEGSGLSLGWYENLGYDTFAPLKGIDSSVSNFLRKIYTEDFDADGDQDVLVVYSNYISWYENLGYDSFSVAKVVLGGVLQDIQDISITDVNGDGYKDVLVAVSHYGKIVWAENMGNDSFALEAIVSDSANKVTSLFSRDLNGDGHNDIGFTSEMNQSNPTRYKVSWHENLGGGNFGAEQIIRQDLKEANFVEAIDLDGDTDLDILFANLYNNRLHWWTNQQEGEWVQVGKDLWGTIGGYDGFGESSSFDADANTIVVGIPNSNGSNLNKARIFDWSGGSWIQRGSDIIGNASNDNFGRAVAMSADGNIVAIGAPIGYTAGYTAIYYWDGSAWVKRGSDIIGEANSDHSGAAISLSANGNIVAIGAPNNNDRGHARIYAWSGSAWVQRGGDLDGQGVDDDFGCAVAMSADGNVVAIGGRGNDAGGSNAGHTKVYVWNGSSWVQRGMDLIGEAPGDQSGHSIDLNASGNTVAIGAYLNDAWGNNTGHIRVFDWSGNLWVQRGSDIDGRVNGSSLGHNLKMDASGNTIAVSSINSGVIEPDYVSVYNWVGGTWIQRGHDLYGEATHTNDTRAMDLSADGTVLSIHGVSEEGESELRIHRFRGIYGYVFQDFSQDCILNSNEIGIENKSVVIQPSNTTVQTNASGFWSSSTLPVGNYSIEVDTVGGWLSSCLNPQSFTITNVDSVTHAPDFGMLYKFPCSEPNISIFAPFLRPGFSNQKIYVRVCNEYHGTQMMDSVSVLVELDTLIRVDTASLLYTNLGNNRFVVPIGDLSPGQCVNFWLDGTLSTNAILGQTICMKAEVSPIDLCVLDTIPNAAFPLPCNMAYDDSHVTIESSCIGNDSIYFYIYNEGSGDMICQSQIRLYKDGVLDSIGSVQLLAGDSTLVVIGADGFTWRIEVDQHPLHLGNSQPSKTMELCGNTTNWTSNLVNAMSHDDHDSYLDIFCGLVSGSYDPNDKTGYPLGVGNDNDILPNQKLEYLIRFQNTGTDTAFTVVIRDTLSPHLNLFSFRSGASSHNYSFRINEPRVLEWTFQNIRLPDSTTNEPNSHGFIKFEVEQNSSLPNGLAVNNTAQVYFDFNAPIITNTSSHTINDGLNKFVGINKVEIQAVFNIKVYPNPTTGQLFIEKEGDNALNVVVVDQLGRILQEQKLNAALSTIDIGQLPTGVYFISISDGKKRVTEKIIKN